MNTVPRETFKLVNGKIATVKYFDKDEPCQNCGYTVFAGQTRWVVSGDTVPTEHYHYGCYAPLVTP